MSTNRNQQDIDNANTVERVKGAALFAAGLLIFNPRLIGLGFQSVVEPEANNFGSHNANS